MKTRDDFVRILSLAGASDQNKEQWLRQRQNGITATEAKRLMLSEREHDKLLVEKLMPQSIPDNQFMSWGREREPLIADHVTQTHSPFLFLEHRVFQAQENEQYLASPDMLGYDADNNAIVCGEIKTSGKSIKCHTKAFEHTGYFYQMQWQMLVLESEYCVYAAEIHDNDWHTVDNHEFMIPTVSRPIYVHIIERDDTIIQEMKRRADNFLAEYNEIRCL